MTYSEAPLSSEFSDIIIQNLEMKRIIRKAEKIAVRDVPTLIRGENPEPEKNYSSKQYIMLVYVKANLLLPLILAPFQKTLSIQNYLAMLKGLLPMQSLIKSAILKPLMTARYCLLLNLYPPMLEQLEKPGLASDNAIGNFMTTSTADIHAISLSHLSI